MSQYTAQLLHDAERRLAMIRGYLRAAEDYARLCVESVENERLALAYRYACDACAAEERATGDCRACAPLRDWLATERQAEGKKDDEAAA